MAEFLAVVIEWSVREVQVPGGDWVTVHLDATTVPGVDVDDLDAIEDVILRDKTRRPGQPRQRPGAGP